MSLSEFERLREADLFRDSVWNPNRVLSLSFRGNELAGETGEACNLLKKLDREKLELVGSRANVEQLAEELADIVICVDLIAMEFGIDLFRAITKKFNKTSIERNLPVFMEEPR